MEFSKWHLVPVGVESGLGVEYSSPVTIRSFVLIWSGAQGAFLVFQSSLMPPSSSPKADPPWRFLAGRHDRPLAVNSAYVRRAYGARTASP